MKKPLLSILFLLALLLIGIRGYASHIFGGELLYTYVSDNTYKVTLTLYGDCGAGTSIFDSLYTARPQIVLYDAGVYVADFALKIEEAGTEVSPVCAAQLNSTKCHGGDLPGVRRFKYSDTVSLPYPYRSTVWSFVFSGYLGSAQNGAGRSNNITNILVPLASSSVMQLTARLNNNILGNNSSPSYSTIPTPYYCINLPGEYNQGAIDPNGDSLSFSLVPATDGNTGADVFYKSPYSATDPLSTSSGSFYFSSLNGQMSFVPDIIQDALVVCQVSEYRRGVLVGTSEREMTFIVLDNCKGTPPTPALNSVVGGTVSGSNVINVCDGSPHLSFDINIVNPDGDNTQLILNNLPAGLNATISNNNTSNPSITFDWVTSSLPTGIYNFFLNINNDHCPLANRSTVGYTINLAPPPVVTSTLLSSTQCLHKALMRYDLNYGYVPRTLTLVTDTGVYKTYIDSTGVIIDSLPLGRYTLVTSSGAQCATGGSIAIVDSGDLPLEPIVKNYCINGPTEAIQAPIVGPEAVVTWYADNGQVLFYPPIPSTEVAGTLHYSYTEQYRQCIKEHIPVSAVIHPLPIPGLDTISMPETICLGDTVQLKGKGGVKYTWQPKDQVIVTDSVTGNAYIRVTDPVNVQVTAIDSFGCKDSTTYQYKGIQYCCQFSYPNAFTPNHDGKNDGFRIISYGNLTQYTLVIYNRWGQQVFTTNDPKQYWDGTFNGVPCDLGTYVYYFKAQCLTGNKAESKGDVTLIR